MHCLEFLSFVSLQHSCSAGCFRNEGCHHGSSSLGNCPPRWFSKQVAFCTKIYQKNVINLPRGEHLPPDFVSSPRFGTCYTWQALKHTPQGPGRAVLSSGEEGTGSRRTQVCAGITLLLGNNLSTAHQTSGRYLWWPSISRRGERALLPQNTHETQHVFAVEGTKCLKDPCSQQSRDEWEAPRALHRGVLLCKETLTPPCSRRWALQSREALSHHSRAAKEDVSPKCGCYETEVFIQRREEGPGFLSRKVFPASTLAVNFCPGSQLQA